MELDLRRVWPRGHVARDIAIGVSARSARFEITPAHRATLLRHGQQPLRILMIGSGVLAGRGLRDHNVGLPGRVADRLVAQCDRGVKLDVLVELDPVTGYARAAAEVLGGIQYDAVFVVLGERHAITGTWSRQWTEMVGGLIQAWSSAAAGIPVVVVDSAQAMLRTGTSGWRGRVAEANADRLGAITAEQVARLDGVSYAELTGGVEDTTVVGRFQHEVYRRWADILVEAVNQLNGTFRPDATIAEMASRGSGVQSC